MRLLVAEVDSALAESLKSRFQQENFSVQLISHSDHLTSLPGTSGFDLILLDMSLPGLAGEDPVAGFTRCWPDTPVILLSSESAVEERIRGLNAGADDFYRPAQDLFIFEDLFGSSGFAHGS